MPPTKKEVTKIKELCYFLCKLWTLFNEKNMQEITMQNLNFWNPSYECKNLFYDKTKYKLNSNQTH